MAVLCEGISAVVRLQAIFARLGDFEKFKELVPNQTLCCDNEIARVGFMAADDVKDFVKSLERLGFVFLEDGAAIDIVVIDQFTGPTTRCDWIEFGRISSDGNKMWAARMPGSCEKLYTPEGWRFEGSLSHTPGYVAEGAASKSFKFLEHKTGSIYT
jgi:hypothetical protein